MKKSPKIRKEIHPRFVQDIFIAFSWNVPVWIRREG